MKWVGAVVILVLVAVVALWPAWVGYMDLMVVEANRSKPGAMPPSGLISFGTEGSGCALSVPRTVFDRTDRIRWVATYDYEVVGDRPAQVELSQDGQNLPGYPQGRTIDAYSRCLDGGSLPALAPGEYTLSIKLDYLPPSTAPFRVGR